MRNIHLATGGLSLLLVACSSGEAPANNAVEETASALKPGLYELVTKVDALRSTDKTSPATTSKVGGAPVTSRSCVGADNAVEATAFAEAGETCKSSEVYIRNGRLSMQLRCNRPGKGAVTHTVDGEFTADTVKGTVVSGSYFSGTGDYEMTRSFTGHRVGECSSKAG